MTAPAWMPLYIADYLADTGHLSAAESGAYLHLIMHYWQRGGLPSDDRALCRIARMTPDEWSDARPVLSELFFDDWRHKRIDAELKKAAETMARRSAAGKRAASVRHDNREAIAEQSHANRMRSACATHVGEGEGTDLDTSSTIQEGASPRKGTTSAPMARLEFASTFWPEYPHKVSTPKALEAFIRARRVATLPEIMDGLARYKSDKPPDQKWLNPANFLDEERWKDEPAPAPARQPNGKPEPPHDPIFRALVKAAQGGSGLHERPPDLDARALDFQPGEGAHRGHHRAVPLAPDAAAR